jgi:DNA-binding SARP family transcriptional activator
MSLQIKLLDTLQIIQDGQPSPVLNSPKGLALLLHLLVVQKPVSREVLADLLWDDRSTSQALGNLRALLFRLRQQISQIKLADNYLSFEVKPED